MILQKVYKGWPHEKHEGQKPLGKPRKYWTNSIDKESVSGIGGREVRNQCILKIKARNEMENIITANAINSQKIPCKMQRLEIFSILQN